VEGYDTIGDVHGCATHLEALLDTLGYRQTGQAGEYRHPRRQAVFVGNLIDRGDEQLRALEIVKAMVDGQRPDRHGQPRIQRAGLPHRVAGRQRQLPARPPRPIQHLVAEEHPPTHQVPRTGQRPRPRAVPAVVQHNFAVAGPR